MTRLETFYRGKTVMVTGHTGFKGSWLALWLLRLGSKVIGYSLDPPTTPSHFEATTLGKRMTDIRGDICDCASLQSAVDEHRPAIIFHLAAQSLVRRSYREPRLTFETNVGGTVNVVDAALRNASVEAVVCVTSDKCYADDNSSRPHREDDPLGGRDPYSASKACAELAIRVFEDPVFQREANPQRGKTLAISSARAGNVIGGGDWAADRLVPDVIRAVTSGHDVIIRNPDAIRPWQHVLEPISGYLWLALMMCAEPQRFSTAFNFGPAPDAPSVDVSSVVQSLLSHWNGSAPAVRISRDQSKTERHALRVDSSRAASDLRWFPAWNLNRAIDETAKWYRSFYEAGSARMFDYSQQQLEAYMTSARDNGVAWAI